MPLTAGSLEDLAAAPAYDLIINATSAAFNNTAFTLPDNIAHPQTRAYDMTYGRDTPFLDWARSHHLTAYDGSTMLQAQAWLSFQQWFPT